MRKFILIAALVLASASAQAAGSRSLSLASNDDQVATEQPKAVEAPKPAESPKAVEDAKPVETPKAEPPKYVDRPAAVNTATETTKTDAVQRATPTSKVAKRKPRRDWTEARVIGELHRHGIYW
jgi:outer membrane biosynthesis protein TonB